MATRAIQSDPSAPAGRRSSTHGSPSSRPATVTGRASRFRRPPVSICPRSADLAGREVALSLDVPVLFDDPLAPHHRLIGRWVASREGDAKTYTREAACRHIERVFETAALEALAPIDFVGLRAVVLRGPDGEPPAITLVCETIGQIDLGWIETSEAPVAWRAAAYHALECRLGRALPIFGFQDLFEEISHYYWDGETEDDAALGALVAYHGADPDDRDEFSLPSEMTGRRPDWMLGDKVGRSKALPTALRHALLELARTHKAMDTPPAETDAWGVDRQMLYEYVPGIEECASLPPLTLVPVEQFARELDDVGRQGMELGFMDVTGLCPLADAKRIDHWFASLSLGVRFLEAAQALISLDPSTL
jgi:hypothetical protein